LISLKKRSGIMQKDLRIRLKELISKFANNEMLLQDFKKEFIGEEDLE